MNPSPGRGRGRGRGNPRPNLSPAGGRQFSGPAAQPQRRHHNSEPKGSSSGRKEKSVYVAKGQQGQNSSEAIEKVKSFIASDLAQLENNNPVCAPNFSALSHMSEEGTKIAETPTKLTDDNVKLELDVSNMLNISCQLDVENSLASKYGDKEQPSSFKDPKTPASDGKSQVSEPYSASFDACPPKAGFVKLKSPLLVKNRKTLNETKRVMEGENESLRRPGMVTLKSSISIQVNLKSSISMRDQEPRGSSSGRKEKWVYVAKGQQGQNSSEAKTYNVEEGKSLIASDLAQEENNNPLCAPNYSALSHVSEEGTKIAETPTKLTDDDVKVELGVPNMLNSSCQDVENSLPSKYGDKDQPSSLKVPKTLASDGKSQNSEPSSASYDICPPKAGSVKLKPSLHAKNRERRNETKCVIDGENISVLRSGMVILKSFISMSEQVKIVKQCRDLGLGHGGFYQPGYRDGAKLHLYMMCLGRNWDPETSRYGDLRQTDGAKPPKIPNEFYQLVEKAIKESHSHIRREMKGANPEEILPWMKPDICLVNYYSANGRLGLHQDRDESPESIRKKLPVVSFSIGDAAEFLYGDQRDVEKAHKVRLESGDVLIFGGDSRNVFHGVKTISADTAPKTLLEETNLRPGRLNLTFRQY